MTTEEMWALRELPGMDVVLVPIPARQKGPRLKNWRKLTAEDMNREAHLQALVKHANTGVLQGRNSGGLCSIDIDIDEEVERFLDYNPSLANTLQTQGERGANLWARDMRVATWRSPLRLLHKTDSFPAVVFWQPLRD